MGKFDQRRLGGPRPKTAGFNNNRPRPVQIQDARLKLIQKSTGNPNGFVSKKQNIAKPIVDARQLLLNKQNNKWNNKFQNAAASRGISILASKRFLTN